MVLTPSLHLLSLYQLGKHPQQRGCDIIQRDIQGVRACAWKGPGREDGRDGTETRLLGHWEVRRSVFRAGVLREKEFTGPLSLGTAGRQKALSMSSLQDFSDPLLGS